MSEPETIDLNDYPETGQFYSPILCEQAIIAGMIVYPEGRAIWRGKTAHLPRPLALFTNERERDIAKIVLELPDGIGYPDVFHEVFERRKVHESHPAVTIKWFLDAADAMMDMRDFDRCFAVTMARAQRRAVAGEATRLAENILTGSTADIDATVTAAADRMRRYLGESGEVFQPNLEAVSQIVENLLEGKGSPAVPSCFSRLRYMAGAWPRGQVSLVCAPTGAGKTAFLMQEMFAAARNGLCVYAWLSESDANQAFVRWCSQVYQVDANLWNPASKSKPDGLTIKSARDKFAAIESNLNLVCRRPRTGEALEADLLAFSARRGSAPDLVVVDYLQTLDAPSTVARDGNQSPAAMTANTMAVWRMAAQTGAAVLCGSQYNREAIGGLDEARRKRPSLAAIKGSGTPAEKAKVVVFLHEPEAVPKENAVAPMEFVVAKANDGRLGEIPALFVRPLTMWMEDTPESRRDWAGVLAQYDAPEPHDPNRSKSAPKGRYSQGHGWRKDVDG